MTGRGIPPVPSGGGGIRWVVGSHTNESVLCAIGKLNGQSRQSCQTGARNS